ncbi:MAG: hypothetical protein RL701_7885 [Pseudomonadota bacterium]
MPWTRCTAFRALTAVALAWTIGAGCGDDDDDHHNDSQLGAGEGGETSESGSGGIGQAGRGGRGGQVAGGKGGAGSAAGGGGVSGQAAAGEICGTRGAEACGPDLYCDFSAVAACGENDRGGKCEAKPKQCSDGNATVCGCDYRTYASACAAHSSGLSVLHVNACSPDDCKAAGGQPAKSSAGAKPACAPADDSWPIAGEAGALCCVPPQRSGTCGGFAGLDCNSDQFCNYESAAGGQGCDGKIADAAGVCESVPQGCRRDYKPVCGCDRHTYENICIAHSFAASVMHEGACTTSDCKAAGGRSVMGTADKPPVCGDDEKSIAALVGDDGKTPEGGLVCCLKN